MSALRSYPGRLLVMFQPHGFSPMRLMGRQIIESFTQTMTDEDILLMPEIYLRAVRLPVTFRQTT